MFTFNDRCSPLPIIFRTQRERGMCDTSPSWTLYTNTTRLSSLREFIFLRAGVTPVMYWITPKAAHTTIVNRLLRRPPFRIVEVVGADIAESARRARFEALRQRYRPFEFTFVREPTELLLSALDQMRFCRQLPAAASVADYLTTFYEFKDNVWPSRACRELHLYPQVAGYPGGVQRLDFIGHVERLQDDWRILLRALNVTSLAGGVAVPRVNQRKRPPFMRQRVNWMTFATHPAIRAHTRLDYECLQFP